MRLRRRRLCTPPPQRFNDSCGGALIAKLRAKHGPLMFHQSGGCCDGSSPMCYPLGEFLVGDSDVLLATSGGGEQGAVLYEPEPV